MWTAEVFNEGFSENQSGLNFSFLKQSKQVETNGPLRRELGIHSRFLLYVGVVMGVVRIWMIQILILNKHLYLNQSGITCCFFSFLFLFLLIKELAPFFFYFCYLKKLILNRTHQGEWNQFLILNTRLEYRLHWNIHSPHSDFFYQVSGHRSNLPL